MLWHWHNTHCINRNTLTLIQILLFSFRPWNRRLYQHLMFLKVEYLGCVHDQIMANPNLIYCHQYLVHLWNFHSLRWHHHCLQAKRKKQKQKKNKKFNFQFRLIILCFLIHTITAQIYIIRTRWWPICSCCTSIEKIIETTPCI